MDIYLERLKINPVIVELNDGAVHWENSDKRKPPIKSKKFWIKLELKN
jgi:hypothetical protein